MPFHATHHRSVLNDVMDDTMLSGVDVCGPAFEVGQTFLTVKVRLVYGKRDSTNIQTFGEEYSEG